MNDSTHRGGKPGLDASNSVGSVAQSISFSKDGDGVSTRVRVSVSPRRRSEATLLNIASAFSHFGEIMKIEMNTFQYDSTFIVCFFDVRATELAKKSLKNDSESAFIIISDHPSHKDAAQRAVRVTGFDSKEEDSKCNELLLSVFSRFGEVETISRSGAGSFIVSFFDCRSPLSVVATLNPKRPSPTFVSVNSEQLIQLLIAGSDSRSLPLPSKSSESRLSSEFAIDLSTLESGDESRTTVMVRNIPRKMSQAMIVEIIRLSFRQGDIFDFIYLPMDLANQINVGYAFINLKSPHHVVTFYHLFNNRTWRSILGTYRINCGEEASKVSKVTFARIQGLECLINHFANSCIMQNQPDSIRPYFRL